MKNIIKVLALSAAILSLTGCAKSRLEQMKMAENIKIDCTPEVLVATAGKIPVSVSVTYPKGYFEPKAMLEVTPVLVYEGGEQVGPTFWYQGEKVKDNNKVVAKDGGTVSEVFAFDYVPGVEKSHLELRSTASMSGYAVEIPAIKVADGTNTTYTLVKTEGVYGFKDDGSQAVIAGSTEGQIVMGETLDPIKVSIGQFYGIEINDFAVTVAKTALWIAESQMIRETEHIVRYEIDFLPLKSYANIVEANALRIDWETVVPKNKLSFIMGNPPFVGSSMMTAQQKAEAVSVFGKGKRINSIDYVGAWYHKAAALMQNTSICAAFVSTNSITQGEQVAALWNKLLFAYKIHIIFAYNIIIFFNS